jgi:sirohydrochlorin cobaltochelatase
MHDIAQRGYKKVQVVPMLLVSGNHYIKDMVEIRDELSERFESFIAPALGPSGRFNLLEFEDIPRLIRRKIFEEIEKFGC